MESGFGRERFRFSFFLREKEKGGLYSRKINKIENRVESIRNKKDK